MSVPSSVYLDDATGTLFANKAYLNTLQIIGNTAQSGVSSPYLLTPSIAAANTFVYTQAAANVYNFSPVFPVIQDAAGRARLNSDTLVVGNLTATNYLNYPAYQLPSNLAVNSLSAQSLSGNTVATFNANISNLNTLTLQANSATVGLLTVSNLQGYTPPVANLSNITGNSANYNYANVATLNANSLNYTTANGTTLLCNTANISTLSSTNANLVNLRYNSAIGTTANLSTVYTNSIQGVTANSLTIGANAASFLYSNINTLTAQVANVSTLFVSNLQGYTPPVANTQNLTGNSLSYSTILAGNMSPLAQVGNVVSNLTISATTLTAATGNINSLTAQVANVGTLFVSNLVGFTATSNVANISGSTFNYVNGNVGNLTSVNANIATLYCSNIQGYSPPVANLQNLAGNSLNYLTANIGNLSSLNETTGNLVCSNCRVTQALTATAIAVNTPAVGYSLDVAGPARATVNTSSNRATALRIENLGSSAGGAIVEMASQFSGLAQSNKVAAQMYAEPDSGTGARWVVATCNTGGTLLQAVNINASQQVGINTSSPQYQLDVTGQARFVTNQVWHQANAPGFFIGNALSTNQSGFLTFNNAGPPSGPGSLGLGVFGVGGLTVSGTGNVGIQQSQPAYLFDVGGTGRIPTLISTQANVTSLQASTLYCSNIVGYSPAQTSLTDISGNSASYTYTTVSGKAILGSATTDTSPGAAATVVNRVANVSYVLPTNQATAILNSGPYPTACYVNTDYNYPNQTGPLPGGRWQVNDYNFGTELRWQSKVPGAAGNNLVERLTINNNGNVGVNQPYPAALLDVAGAAKATSLQANVIFCSNVVGLSIPSASNLYSISGNNASYTYISGTQGNVSSLQSNVIFCSNVVGLSIPSAANLTNVSGNSSSYTYVTAGNVAASNVTVSSNLVVQGQGVNLSGLTATSFGYDVAGKELNAGRIGYGLVSAGGYLDVLGAGTSTTTRKVQLFDGLTVSSGTSGSGNGAITAGVATLNGNVNTSGSVTYSTGNPGDMIVKAYSSPGDRYGVGQYQNGTVRVFTSSAYAPATLNLSLASTDGGGGTSSLWSDIVTVSQSSVVFNRVINLPTTSGVNLSSGGTTNYGYDVSGKDPNAGRIGYGSFSGTSLDIVGAGTGPPSRSVRIWEQLGVGMNPSNALDVAGNGRLSGTLTASTAAVGTFTGNPTFSTNQLYQQGSAPGLYMGSGFSTGNAGFITFNNAGPPSGPGTLGLGVYGQSPGGGLSVANTGYVGINYSTPAFPLDVGGAARISGNLAVNSLANPLTVNAVANVVHFIQGQGYQNLFLGNTQSTGGCGFLTFNNPTSPGYASSLGIGVYGAPGGITCSPNGSVGISQTQPSASVSLDCYGPLRAQMSYFSQTFWNAGGTYTISSSNYNLVNSTSIFTALYTGNNQATDVSANSLWGSGATYWTIPVNGIYNLSLDGTLSAASTVGTQWVFAKYGGSTLNGAYLSGQSTCTNNINIHSTCTLALVAGDQPYASFISGSTGSFAAKNLSLRITLLQRT